MDRNLNLISILRYTFLFLVIVSCNTSQKKRNLIRNNFIANEKNFLDTIKKLEELIQKNTILLSGSHLFFVVSESNSISQGKIENIEISNFLRQNNFSGIHIYNNYSCDNGKIEYQAFQFESLVINYYLEYDKCIRLAPTVENGHFENTRVAIDAINANWKVVYEKY